MLSLATLATAAQCIMDVFSPSRNPCKVRVSTARFRFNPYAAKVIPSPLRMCPPTPTRAVTPTEAATLAPAAPKKTSTPRYALVSFKQEKRVFLAPFRIAAGDHVVVEGDRGEQVGVVSDITINAPADAESCPRVLRRCTPEELRALEGQREKEAAALRKCRELASSLGIVSRNGAKVHDAEFQSDMSKITVYFSRPTPTTFVDFRKLQRGLFREFRCRIWLAYMDEVEDANDTARALFA
jgi:hypothetical protein